MALFDLFILHNLYPFLGLQKCLGLSFSEGDIFFFWSEGAKCVLETSDELKHTLSWLLSALAQVLNTWSMKTTEIFPQRLQSLVIRHSAQVRVKFQVSGCGPTQSCQEVSLTHGLTNFTDTRSCIREFEIRLVCIPCFIGIILRIPMELGESHLRHKTRHP
jgi:hypothetical protein